MATSAGVERADITYMQSLGVDKCVFCQSAKTRRKVLFCLHLCCTDCLTEYLSGSNTVCCARCQVDTPDPGPGRKLLEALADWPDSKATASDCTNVGGEDERDSLANAADKETGSVVSRSFCQDPDCSGDFAAVGRCSSCDLLLCDAHAATHVRNRRTLRHSVELFQQDGDGDCSSDSSLPRCQLHSNAELVKFCKGCKVMLCLKCCPTHSSHEVSPLQEAADKVRDDALSVLEEENSDEETMMEQVVQYEKRITKQLEELDCDTAEASDVMTAEFAKCHQLLSQRELEAKADLDAIRWRRAKPLDETKNRYQERRGRLVTSRILLRDLKPVSLLRVSAGVEESLSQSANKREAPDKDDGVRPGAEVRMFSKRLKEDLDTLRHISTGDTGPITTGTTQTAYCNLFDPRKKEPGIALSCQNQVATAWNEKQMPADDRKFKWQAVNGCGSFNHGCIEFSMQVVKLGCAFIGVASSMQMALDANIPGFLGWADGDNNIPHTLGGKLGQPWRNDDIINLTLDLDAHKLAAVNKRSGDTDSIAIPRLVLGSYCLRLILYNRESVRLLVP